jgi:tetratricopeptide (TPR) repeat protein
LLKQVLQKQGKEYVGPGPEALSNVEMAPTAEEEATPTAAESAPAAEAALVKEALENSDLFSRYGLVDKAVAELEKALENYPDQIDIHERILEVSQRTNPARAGVAAVALARIFNGRGDSASAHRYEEIARSHGAPLAERQKTAEFDLRTGGAVGEATPPVQEFPLDQAETLPAESGPAQAADGPGFDLSEDLEALGAPAASAPTEPKTLAFNHEEARVEIDFYIEQGFADEAEKAVEAYEKNFPGNPQVAALRQRLEARVAAASAAPPDVEPPAPQSFSAEAATAPAPPPAAGTGMLESLASDLASSLEGIEPSPAAQPPPAQPDAGGATQLSGLLEELREPAGAQAAQDDPETHYSLGVAFREMGLLDEAIGEFQKVVKNTQKGRFPPHFLQACTLLASSFMEKKMPAIAAKWYLRALEMPDLDDEATLALHYDLGVAYEQSGETRTALEKFTEVYSQNIDYRDVAEKIRLLQQRVS